MLVVYWRVSYSCKCDSRPLSCHLSFWKRDKRLCECKRRAYGWCLMKRCTFATLILCGEVIFIFTFQKHLQSRVLPATWGSTAISARYGRFLVVSHPPNSAVKFLLPLETVGGLNTWEARIEWSCARCASCRSACGNKDDFRDQQGPVL